MVCLAASLLVHVTVTAAPAVAASVGWRGRVAARLLALYDAPRGSSPSTLRFDSSGRVQIDVRYDCTLAPPTVPLAAAGLAIDTAVRVPPLCAIEGWTAPAALPALASVSGVTRIEVPQYALPKQPLAPASVGPPAAPATPRAGAHAQALTPSSIDGGGVSIMHASEFVAQTGTGGAGVTVGVQSTGVASLALIQFRGELPAVRVVDPSGGSSAALADEGTVLLEEVHAVAPRATLVFCGPQTFVQYLSCLQQLIGAGASILADDLSFPPQDLMSSDSADAAAVAKILVQNPAVVLFTAAGNNNGTYWEGAYAPLSAASQGLTPLSCTSDGIKQVDSYVAQFGASAAQTLTVSTAASFPIAFAWADPAGENASNFDLYWFDASSGEQLGCLSAASQSANLLGETLTLAAGTYTLYIATPDERLAGKFLKLWIGGDGLTMISTPTPGSIIAPQAYAPGVLTIGAVNGSNGVGDSIESFSSLGPLSVEFPSAAQLQAPTLVAPDGIYVDAAGTYFASYIFPDGDFYGTSASVPNAAAVAALIRGAFPSLTAPQLLMAIEAGATPLGQDGVPDDTFGYGRIDALGALGMLPAPTISALPDSTIDAAASSPGYPFTVSGTGPLHFTVTSSDPALIPPSIVASGVPGVTITPAKCGSAVFSCTLTVTPASGVGGMAQVRLAAVDGANRSASAAMSVTVTNPIGQVVAVGSSAGGGGGGGALEPWTLAWLALLAAARCTRGAMRVPSASQGTAKRDQGARP